MPSIDLQLPVKQSVVVEWLSIELWVMRTQIWYPTQLRKELGIFSFTSHCPSSLSCINEYLAIDTDGLCERIVYRSVIAARLNASQRSWTCVCTNRSARGVIVSALNSKVDWILHVKHLTFVQNKDIICTSGYLKLIFTVHVYPSDISEDFC